MFFFSFNQRNEPTVMYKARGEKRDLTRIVKRHNFWLLLRSAIEIVDSTFEQNPISDRKYAATQNPKQNWTYPFIFSQYSPEISILPIKLTRTLDLKIFLCKFNFLLNNYSTTLINNRPSFTRFLEQSSVFDEKEMIDIGINCKCYKS